jgi:large subunit ribosomal protein L9
MKVILRKDVKGLGPAGTVTDVTAGYARNYLVPRGLAEEATEHNLQTLQRQQHTVAQRAQREQDHAHQLVAALEAAVIELHAKGGEDGRLFGSITAADVASALASRGYDVGKKQVILDEPIKAAGFYKVTVRVGQGVVARIDLNVIAGD